MFNLKKETIKKNICLTLSIISAFVFTAGLMCTIMGDSSPVGAFLCLPFDVGKISVAFAACERVCFVFFSKYKIGVSQFYRSVNCNTPINVFLLSVPFDLIGCFVSKAPQPLAFPVNQHIAFYLTLCCCTQMTGIPFQ